MSLSNILEHATAILLATYIIKYVTNKFKKLEKKEYFWRHPKILSILSCFVISFKHFVTDYKQSNIKIIAYLSDPVTFKCGRIDITGRYLVFNRLGHRKHKINLNNTEVGSMTVFKQGSPTGGNRYAGGYQETIGRNFLEVFNSGKVINFFLNSIQFDMNNFENIRENVVLIDVSVDPRIIYDNIIFVDSPEEFFRSIEHL